MAVAALSAGTGIGAIVYMVRDLDRTQVFYNDVLGVPVEREEEPDEAYLHAKIGAPDGKYAPLTLVFFEADVTVGASPIAVFEIDAGIDDVVERLVANDVEIVAPVAAAPDGGLTADFADPDAHVLSVYQPPGAPRRQAADVK